MPDVVQHLGVPHASRSPRRAARGEPAPSDHVLAEVEDEHTRPRFGESNGLEFLRDADRIVRLRDELGSPGPAVPRSPHDSRRHRRIPWQSQPGISRRASYVSPFRMSAERMGPPRVVRHWPSVATRIAGPVSGCSSSCEEQASGVAVDVARLLDQYLAEADATRVPAVGENRASHVLALARRGR